MSIKPYLWLLLVFAACGQKKKEGSNPLAGNWQYERIELLDGEPVDITDTLYSGLHDMHKGLTFDFSEDYVFTVTQPKAGDPEGFVARQKYELSDSNKTLVLKNTGRPDDVFPIIELSDSTFRIDVFRSGWGYVVFRKKKE